MLALKQWKVEYVYRYKNNRYAEAYGENADFAIVMADTEAEARMLVTEAAKTGAFDWAQHEFVSLRMMSQPSHAHTLVLSDRAINMIRNHIDGSYIERKDLEVDFDLPLGREE